jgi:phage-related protein
MGSAVREIRVRESSGTFRCMYLATRPEALCVLHCFQKKSQRTSRSDLDLAMKRFRAIAR